MKLKDGVWFSDESSIINYPAVGNDLYFQIEDNSFWFKNRNELIKQTILKFKEITKDISFLDLGGGNGMVAKSCQDLGLDTYLVEPGAGALNAKARGIQNVYCCKLNELPKNLCFDIVGAFDVIEHIDSPVQFLMDLKPRLKDSGLVVLTVPAYNLLWSDEDDSAGHCRRYTVRSLAQELKKAGYTVQHCSYFFLPLLPLIFFLRALPYRLKMKSKVQMSDDHHVHLDQTDKVKNEHVLGPWLNTIFDCLFSMERFFIKRLAKLPLGSSIIVVAKLEN